jgi:microcephalin
MFYKNRDKNLVKSIVRSLGAAEMELNVSKRTTHVISTGVRTVNLLRGIIRGCWLITLEWVLKSLENNAWLDPEEFEMKHFSKAVQVRSSMYHNYKIYINLYYTVHCVI